MSTNGTDVKVGGGGGASSNPGFESATPVSIEIFNPEVQPLMKRKLAFISTCHYVEVYTVGPNYAHAVRRCRLTTSG